MDHFAMGWGAAIRTSIVLICVFNPFSVFSFSSKKAAVQFRSGHSAIILSALCTAFTVVFALYVLSVFFSAIDLKEMTIGLSGGVILLVSASLNLTMQWPINLSKSRCITKHTTEMTATKMTIIPGIAALSFILSDTNGSPSLFPYVILVILSVGYYVLLGIKLRRGRTVPQYFVALSQVPRVLVVIVAVDLMVHSLSSLY